MKKFLLLCLLVFFFAFIGFQIVKNKVRSDLAQIVPAPTTPPTPTPISNKTIPVQNGRSIFVPYWAIDGSQLSTANNTQIIYFGASASSSGSLTDDQGLADIQTFTAAVPSGKETLLTLQMIDNTTDFAILKHISLQTNLISQTITTAKENGFSGVVLDLEISALPFDEVVQQIDQFVNNFSKSAHKNNLTFSLLLYGDSFYRLRPFDVKTLGQETDHVMIMAYDFSKANGDPGPNFPLTGSQIYGYDMTKMIADFTQAVPVQKLLIVFGRFGYDWTVDGQGHSTQTATPLTDLQIRTKFLNNCQLASCVIHRDPLSKEMEITYTDDRKQKHVVWFEDAQSVMAKEKYLQKVGINQFADWAYSYF